MISTPNFGLQIPEEDDIYSIEYMQHNLPIIDKNLQEKRLDSTTVIADDGSSIRTDLADGTYTVASISADGNTITTSVYSEDSTLLEKRIVTINGNTIEEKEVAI